MISALIPAAEMADNATRGTRVINLSILRVGIMVEGVDFVLKPGMEHAITLKAAELVTWTKLDVAGVAEIERVIAVVVAKLDRAKAKA